MIPPFEYLVGEVLRVSPALFYGVSIFLWGIFYISLPWLIWILGGVISSWVIHSEHVNTEYVDAQLIRLGARLSSITIGIAVIVEGANRLGLPAYSVIAGLGIGGLAIALAGQQALANLLGSLIIMFEKPFRVGQVIRTSGIEGKVEDIGFRSTRVRTADNTLVIIPSASLINSSIENMSLRRSWRIQRTFYLDSKTSIDVVREIREEVEKLLLADETISREAMKVIIDRVNLDTYELLVEFRVKAKTESERLKIAENFICDVAAIVESKGISLGRLCGISN
jgi:MscS family membrane protein